MSSPDLEIIIAKSPGDILSVKYEPDEPIHHLLDRMHCALGTDEDTVSHQELFLNGTRLLNHELSMEYYRIVGHTLTYRAVPARVPGPGGISVHVNCFAGRTLAFNCYRDTAIGEIKAMIQSREGISSQDQRLIFEGKQLQDDGTLTSYHIRDLSTLFLLTSLNGGGRESTAPTPLRIPFADIANTAGLCKIQLTHYNLPGRIAHIDTNVECRCECTPTHTVICGENFETLELAGAAFLCPNCHQSHRITPIASGFMKCKYRLHGIKISGEQYTSEWKEIAEDNLYEVFNPDNKTFWRRLIIESAALDACEDCPICLDALRDFETLRCGHQFHADCIKRWLGPCPICRCNKIFGPIC